MVPRSILVTGSNRGIGLELVTQLAQLVPSPEVILAACRKPETAQVGIYLVTNSMIDHIQRYRIIFMINGSS